MFTTSII